CFGHMHTFKPLLFATTLLSLLGPVSAEEPSSTYRKSDLRAAETLRVRASTDATAYQLVQSLTTEVGARPAGSAGDRAAVAWAVREMQRLGFSQVRTMEVKVP